jgi:hypothetical protein
LAGSWLRVCCKICSVLRVADWVALSEPRESKEHIDFLSDNWVLSKEGLVQSNSMKQITPTVILIPKNEIYTRKIL